MQYLTQWQLMTEVSETAHNYPSWNFAQISELTT